MSLIFDLLHHARPLNYTLPTILQPLQTGQETPAFTSPFLCSTTEKSSGCESSEEQSRHSWAAFDRWLVVISLRDRRLLLPRIRRFTPKASLEFKKSRLSFLSNSGGPAALWLLLFEDEGPGWRQRTVNQREERCIVPGSACHLFNKEICVVLCSYIWLWVMTRSTEESVFSCLIYVLVRYIQRKITENINSASSNHGGGWLLSVGTALQWQCLFIYH